MTDKKSSGLEDAAEKAGALVTDDADENLPPKSVKGPGGRDQQQPTRQVERAGRDRPGQVDPQ